MALLAELGGTASTSLGMSIQSWFEWLDHDELGQLLADGEARVANLTDEIRNKRSVLE